MNNIINSLKKTVAVGVIGAATFGGGAVASTNDSSFNSLELVDRTADHVQSCTDYCIVGMELRVYWTWRGPRYYRTLVVEHNMPDMLVQTATVEKEMPWDIYRNTFSKIVSSVADKSLRATTGILEFGGGHTQSSEFGQTQAITFKEANVMGNPNLFMFELLGSRIPNSGAFSPQSNGGQTGGILSKPNLRPHQENQLEGMVNGMQQGFANMPLSIVQAMGGAAVRAYTQIQPKVLLWRTLLKQFVNTFKAGAKIDRYTCNASAQPMMPYYTSLFDFAQWRGGYPITDVHKSDVILNPLGSDWLRPEGMEMLANKLGGAIPYGWGRIYPRTGFVNHSDDYKVGTITAVRAVSVVSDSSVGRVRSHVGGGLGKVMWQQVHPSTSQCHYNVTNTINGADNNVAKNYAWNGWRRTKCSLRTRGSKVMDIPFPRICMRDIYGGGVNR